MTDISKDAVDALIDHLRGMGEHEAPPALAALRAALDEAEAVLTRTEANRDAILADLQETVAEENKEKTISYVKTSNQYSLNVNLQKVLSNVTRTGPTVSESMKGQLASYVRSSQ